MTVHSAKGLEFPVVFIVGLEENLFPSQFAIKPSEVEEERRLLYVAITRAEEQCMISYARQRFRNGSITFASPSRFLKDIDRQFFEASRPVSTPSTPRISSIPSITNRPSFSSIPSTPISSSWKEGDRVSHRVFGVGTVLRVYRDEVTENDKIEIAFDAQGTKTLLLTHARLDRA